MLRPSVVCCRCLAIGFVSLLTKLDYALVAGVVFQESPLPFDQVLELVVVPVLSWWIFDPGGPVASLDVVE